MSTGRPLIPTEIMEVIIDHLHNDKKSLTACCLVSRTWLPTSRLHLIPSITVHYRNYEKLIKLLESPKSLLPCSVSQLRLTARPHANISFYDSTENGWLNVALPTLTRYFSFITSLVLQNIFWKTLTLQSQITFLNAFPKVEELDISCCYFSGFRQHAELLCSFKVANSIDTVGCSYDTSSEYRPPYDNLKISPFVRKFTINGRHPGFVAWLGSQLLSNLEHCKIQLINIPYPTGLQRLVSQAGSALHHLQLEFGAGYVYPVVKQTTFDLSQNFSLEKLDIAFYLPFFDIDASFFVATFYSISSSNLRQIRVRILMNNPESLSALDWSAIDDMATERIWRTSLQSVYIELIPTTSQSIREDFMGKAELIVYPGLSKIAKRGLLDVRFDTLATVGEW